MFRILRAFTWLRWRVLMNSFERHGSRDVLERLSLAVEQIAPLLVALVMLPSAAALAGIGLYAGWSLASDARPGIVVTVLRSLLLAGSAFAVLGPLALPAGDRTNAVRLLLLPVPRTVLYVGQVLSTVADPWIVLVAAAVAGVPVGFALAGAPGAALLAAAAGLLLLVTLTGVTLTVTSMIQLAVRDRRRGEILTLLVIMLLPLLSMLPAMAGGRAERARHADSADAGTPPQAAWREVVVRRAAAAVPSEIYRAAVQDASAEGALAAAPRLAALAAWAILPHALACAVFLRLLGSPASGGARRAGSLERVGTRRIPGASAAVSAVAVNQLKLALRTPRGRSIIFSPLVVFFLVAMFRWGGVPEDVAYLPLDSGLGVASFASFLSLLAILPLAMNQFAVDRAGLTLMFLAPLDTRTLLYGKALGNALVTAIPCAISIAGAFAMFPAGHPALWASIPLTLIAAYLLVAPVAAALSATFPKAVDMNSIGQGSNAHGLAGFAGMLAFAAAGGAGLLIVLAATSLLKRPVLAPVLLAGWAVVCAVICALAFRAVAALFERRRENLGMVA